MEDILQNGGDIIFFDWDSDDSADHTGIVEKVENGKGYLMTGELEIVNNDDIYNYDVSSAYQKGDYYRISLTNQANDHEQIILKNDDGLFVQTHESTQQKNLIV